MSSSVSQLFGGFFVYLPAGRWTVTMQGSALSWRIANDAKAGLACSLSAVTARKGGWHPISYIRSTNAAAAQLVLRRRG